MDPHMLTPLVLSFLANKSILWRQIGLFRLWLHLDLARLKVLCSGQSSESLGCRLRPLCR